MCTFVCVRERARDRVTVIVPETVLCSYVRECAERRGRARRAQLQRTDSKGGGKILGGSLKKKYKLYQLTRDTVAIKDTDER